MVFLVKNRLQYKGYILSWFLSEVLSVLSPVNYLEDL